MLDLPGYAPHGGGSSTSGSGTSTQLASRVSLSWVCSTDHELKINGANTLQGLAAPVVFHVVVIYITLVLLATPHTKAWVMGSCSCMQDTAVSSHSNLLVRLDGVVDCVI